MKLAGFWHYDVHGLLRVTSSIALPDLGYFIAPATDGGPADLVILPERARGVTWSSETSACLVASSGVEVQFGGQRAWVHVPARMSRTPYALFANVVGPLLAWSLAQRGHALVHAGCIAVDGQGVLLAAPPGGGKTAACLAALSDPDISFLADDTVIVSPDGRVLALPKALKLSRATIRQLDTVVGLSRSARLQLTLRAAVHARRAHALARTASRGTRRVPSVATAVHRLVPPPRLSVSESATRVPILRDAPVAQILLLDRHTRGVARIERVSLAEARATLAVNSAAARRETLDSSLVGVLEHRGVLGRDEIHLPTTTRCERLTLTDPTQLRANLLDRSHAPSICTA